MIKMEQKQEIMCGSCQTRKTLEEARKNWLKCMLRCGDAVWTCDKCQMYSHSPSMEYHNCCTSTYMSKILAKCVICNQVEDPSNRITWIRNTQNYWYCLECYENMSDN